MKEDYREEAKLFSEAHIEKTRGKSHKLQQVKHIISAQRLPSGDESPKKVMHLKYAFATIICPSGKELFASHSLLKGGHR